MLAFLAFAADRFVEKWTVRLIVDENGAATEKQARFLVDHDSEAVDAACYWHFGLWLGCSDARLSCNKSVFIVFEDLVPLFIRVSEFGFD